MDKDETRKIRQKILKALVETNDAVLIVVGNFVEDDSMEMEYAVDCQEDELFEMFSEIFRDDLVRSEARKAILYSDYGNKDIDSLNLN